MVISEEAIIENKTSMWSEVGTMWYMIPKHFWTCSSEEEKKILDESQEWYAFISAKTHSYLQRANNCMKGIKISVLESLGKSVSATGFFLFLRVQC